VAIISNAVTIADAGAFSVGLGNMVHIKTLTANNTANLTFTHGSSNVILDGTYPIYLFKFVNIHPSTDQEAFQFNLSVDTGSNYNVTKTTTAFYSYHSESNDGLAGVEYLGAHDLAQATGFQNINNDIGNGNDENMSGEMYLFSPASTTFVKHFISRANTYHGANQSSILHLAGYGNTTTAVDSVRFQMSSGNFDQGVIKLYGIKDS
jgi:hypothetical protein